MNDNYYLLVKRNECIVQGTKSILPVSMHHFSISFLLVQFEVSNRQILYRKQTTLSLPYCPSFSHPSISLSTLTIRSLSSTHLVAKTPLF